jgi:hypothetical protein
MLTEKRVQVLADLRITDRRLRENRAERCKQLLVQQRPITTRGKRPGVEQSDYVTFAKQFCHSGRILGQVGFPPAHNLLIACASGEQNCHSSANGSVHASPRRVAAAAGCCVLSAFGCAMAPIIEAGTI